MKWYKPKKVSPQPDDERTIVKFAWFPKRVGDYIIWLQEYNSHQWYFVDPTGYPNLFNGWHETRASL